ncbi:MAG: Carbohydrate kinase, partial [Bacteroidota bacterium]|nr:Carbohydrate kinase [Bacteroidota bacterium]
DGISVGIGLHDSSAALIPYILNFTEPFVLLSTGTWSISLNPFNDKPLTSEELHNDCLCFLQYKNVPVKAARLFAGNTHEIETKRIAKHFGIPNNFFKEITYNKEIIAELKDKNSKDISLNTTQIEKCLFESRDLNNFENYEIAYNQLIIDIVEQQKISTHLVIHNSPVKKIFVDGGFSKNSIFMNLLAQAYPQMEVYAASMAQASALGAALAIHNSWNPKPIQNDLIDLKFYKH